MVHVFDCLLQVSDVFVLCLGEAVLELHKLADIIDLFLVALDQIAHAINLFAHIVQLLH
jgi:hypothetical protein